MQPPYQEQYKSCSEKEAFDFVKQNPDPDKVKVPFLVKNNKDWQKAYNNLRVFDIVASSELQKLFQKEPHGLSDEKIEAAVHSIIQQTSLESLKKHE